nr:hypothetical protein Iba_chr02fCG10490 [Ipomoea batatas]
MPPKSDHDIFILTGKLVDYWKLYQLYPNSRHQDKLAMSNEGRQTIKYYLHRGGKIRPVFITGDMYAIKNGNSLIPDQALVKAAGKLYNSRRYFKRKDPTKKNITCYALVWRIKTPQHTSPPSPLKARPSTVQPTVLSNPNPSRTPFSLK